MQPQALARGVRPPAGPRAARGCAPSKPRSIDFSAMGDDEQPALDELESKVSAWLNRSGFPLEMRVAQAFKERLPHKEWEVETNVPYTDPTTGVTRERDLVANTYVDIWARRGVSIALEYFVECKSTASPWVILKEEFDRPDQLRPLFTAHGGGPRILRREQHDGQLTKFCEMIDKYLKGRLPLVPKPGYGIAEAFKAPNQNDATYGATRQVLASMNYTMANFYDDVEEKPSIAYFFPIVITTSPLFEAALDLETSRIVTRQVSRSAVVVPNEKTYEAQIALINDKAIASLLDDIHPVRSELSTFLDLYDRSVLDKPPEPSPSEPARN